MSLDETECIFLKKERQRQASLRWKWRNIDRVRENQRLAKAKKREEDREGQNKKQREYLASSPRVKIKNLLRLAKKRALEKNIEFDVSIDDLSPNEFCPLLGIRINYAASGRGAVDESPSLDRIDNSKGYVKGNVWIVSWRANRIKSNASIFELEIITRNLRKRMKHNERK